MLFIKLFISFLLALSGVFLFTVLTVSIWCFYTAQRHSNIKMSFEQFRRVYNLSPSKWYCRDDEYIMERVEYVAEENGKGVAHKKVSVSMKTYFDFWCLVIWQWKIYKAEKKEETFKDEIKSLKLLSSMLSKDAEEIQKRTQEQMETLSKKIEEIHSNS